MLIEVATYIQLFTFFISLLTWSKYKHTRLKYLPILLGVTACLEVFCYNFYPTNNVWLYNLKALFEFNFLCFIFYGYLGKLSRKICIGMIAIFNLIYFFNFLVIQDFRTDLLTYTYVLSSFFFIIIIIMVLNEMLKVESFDGIQRNLLFWVSAAYFIFYATTFPIFSISNLKELLGDFQLPTIKVLLVVILIMHSTFITGFLWSKKKYSY